PQRRGRTPDRVQPVPRSAARRRRRGSLSRVSDRHGQAARRSLVPHGARSAAHRDRRIVDGGPLQLVRLAAAAGRVLACRRDEPSLWFARHRLFDFVETAPLPRGRIYLDVGTAEGAGTLRDVRTLRAILEAKGASEGESFSYVEARGGRHDEQSWSKRLGAALQFLLT